MILRPYQEQARADVHDALKKFRIVLMVLPVGGGKTIVFSKLAEDWIAADVGARVLIAAHRDELILQGIDKLHRATGLVADKEKAEDRASLNARVVVGSVQTMQGRRLERWPEDHFTHIIIDEGHHLLAQTYRNLIARFPNAKIVIVTATPERSDKQNLGEIVEHIAYEITLDTLIDDGYLAPICWSPQPLKINLGAPLPPDKDGNARSEGVRVSNGDFRPDDLADAIEPYLAAVADNLCECAPFRRTLVFLPLIATSKKFAAICNEKGLRAQHVDGESPDRKEILQRFARNEFDVLVNAMLLTEGYDDPGIDCVLVLRPTKSRPLFCQMVGRGTRLAPGKRNLLLPDYLFLLEKHNLICPADLIAESREDAEEMKRIAREKAAGGATQEELDIRVINTEAQAQREAKLAEELKKKEKKKARVIDAMEFCLSIHEVGIADYEPCTSWEGKPVTDGQRQVLLRWKIDPDSLKCAGHASKMISKLIDRQKLKLATPRQMRVCKQFGWAIPATTTYEQADRYITARTGRANPKKQMEMAA